MKEKRKELYIFFSLKISFPDIQKQSSVKVMLFA